MAPLAVHVKHAGKVHDVELDPDLPPNVFKEAVYQVTGVPVDRMKIMVKGGVLKVRLLNRCGWNQNLNGISAGGLELEEDRTQGGMHHRHTSRWSRYLIASQGQTFMVIGTAGELPKAPEKPIVFLEGKELLQ